MNTYLVLDIGTSSTKISLFNDKGKHLKTQSYSYDVLIPAVGWAEQDPEIWWSAICKLCENGLLAAEKEKINAIIVVGQTPSCVPVDVFGNPVHPAILWLDRRSTPQVEWLNKKMQELQVAPTSANRLDSYFGGLKWLWFKQTQPDLYQQTWKILQANGYIIFKLTGQVVIDPSQAGLCSPCFDSLTHKWSSEVLELMGIQEEKLPEITPSDQVVGTITRDAARQTGLSIGTPVICGGADFAFSCLGAGVINNNQAAIMLGTAGNLLVPNLPGGDSRLLNTEYFHGTPLSLGGVMAGGVLTWFTKSVLGSAEEKIFDDLENKADLISSGADGLVFLPYLMGERTPIWDPQARGAWIGLTSRHNQAHLYRAILEGITFAFKQMAIIIKTCGGELEHVVIMDGGAKSRLWRQIFADILNLPVYWYGDTSGTGLGAAFFAAKALKQETDFSDIRKWLPSPIVARPNEEVKARYDELYSIYTNLYTKLASDFHALGKIGI